MISGLTTLCSSRPNFSHSRLSGLSEAGRSRAAARNSAATAPVHGQIRPRCQPFSADTSANAAAITRPNVRSEPATMVSSRENTSWVDWAIFDRGLPSVIPVLHLYQPCGVRDRPFFSLASFYALQALQESWKSPLRYELSR